jgi:hypothetical protein
MTVTSEPDVTFRDMLHPAAAKRTLIDAGDRPFMTWHQDAITCLLATWLIMGLYMDGWAHSNQTTLDSLATPWHALFYGSFMVLSGWILWHFRFHHDGGHRGLAAIPVGYGGALAGLVIFTIGGIGDQIWHLSLGIERDLKAFISPTHLLLIIGMLLMLSAPFRSQWAQRGPRAPSFPRILPALWSITLTMMLTAITYNYAFAYAGNLPQISQKGFVAGFPGQTSIALLNVFEQRFEAEGVLVLHMTTFMLVLPILVMLRRWQKLPFGCCTFLFTGFTAATLVMFQYANGWTLIAAVAAGLICDWLIQVLEPNTSNVWSFRLFALLAPVALWTTYFIVVAIAYHLGWALELSAGVVVLTGLATMALSFLIAPSPIPPYTDPPPARREAAV